MAARTEQAWGERLEDLIRVGCSPCRPAALHWADRRAGQTRRNRRDLHRAAYVNEAFLVLTSVAQEGDLLGGKSARCIGYGSYDVNGAYHEDGRCTFVDADGDQIFETYVIGSDVDPGRGQITGGTGKYQKIKGEYVLTYEPMATFAGGHSTGRGTKKGNYTIGE